MKLEDIAKEVGRGELEENGKEKMESIEEIVKEIGTKVEEFDGGESGAYRYVEGDERRKWRRFRGR